ncbi:complex I subunit 1/NuoH family protein [Ornithinimicrobium sp. W1665]|uniref:complex I subunit 1/NuoH family protein n=1 Tax=Ornithinimicrobium sp. W1665 TaxID=3416666 RepID=UPI003D6B6D98
MSLTGIVQEWSWWWLLWQAPAAFVFLAASVAELQRTPFDAPIADSEVVFGPLTEYTGLRFAFFLLAEYAGMVVMALLFTVLFLGGWRGPWADAEVVGVVGVVGVLWTLLKATAVGLVFLWLRVAWPRVREDQLQRFAWLVLLPVALLQLAVTGVGVVFLS